MSPRRPGSAPRRRADSLDPTLVPRHEVAYRVRFDECTPAGLARTSALLRYAQDVAWIHSERLGFDRDWYASRGLTWLVRGVELEVRQPIPVGTVLGVSTAVVGFRKVWARRRTEARDADDRLAAWAHTDWVMTDGRGVPLRVPDEFPAIFAAPPGPFEPTRVTLPPEPTEASAVPLAARPQDLDPMGHVNNAAYLDYLEEAMLDHGAPGARVVAALPRRYRVEYLLPAAPGARLISVSWDGGDRSPDGSAGSSWAWRLGEAGGRDLARGWLTG